MYKGLQCGGSAAPNPRIWRPSKPCLSPRNDVTDWQKSAEEVHELWANRGTETRTTKGKLKSRQQRLHVSGPCPFFRSSVWDLLIVAITSQSALQHSRPLPDPGAPLSSMWLQPPGTYTSTLWSTKCTVWPYPVVDSLRHYLSPLFLWNTLFLLA